MSIAAVVVVLYCCCCGIVLLLLLWYCIAVVVVDVINVVGLLKIRIEILVLTYCTTI